jgi:hypothetical protein
MKFRVLLRNIFMKDSPIEFSGKEEISPGKFLRIERAERGRFSEVEIRPPRLGEKGFGKIVVKRDIGIPKRDRSR